MNQYDQDRDIVEKDYVAKKISYKEYLLTLELIDLEEYVDPRQCIKRAYNDLPDKYR